VRRRPHSPFRRIGAPNTAVVSGQADNHPPACSYVGGRDRGRTVPWAVALVELDLLPQELDLALPGHRYASLHARSEHDLPLACCRCRPSADCKHHAPPRPHCGPFVFLQPVSSQETPSSVRSRRRTLRPGALTGPSATQQPAARGKTRRWFHRSVGGKRERARTGTGASASLTADCPLHPPPPSTTTSTSVRSAATTTTTPTSPWSRTTSSRARSCPPAPRTSRSSTSR
jgi:hypothetical protein